MQHTKYYQDYSLTVTPDGLIFKDTTLDQIIVTLKKGTWYYKDQGYQNNITPVKDVTQYLNRKEINALAMLFKPLALIEQTQCPVTDNTAKFNLLNKKE